MLTLQELPGLATLQLPAETPFCLQGARGEPAAATLPWPQPGCGADTAKSQDAGQETQCHQARVQTTAGLGSSAREWPRQVWKADVCLCSELATERSLWLCFSGAELRNSTEEQNAWLGAPLAFLHDFWSSQMSSDLLVRSHMAVLCPMGLFTSIVSINFIPLLIRNLPKLQLLIFLGQGS